MNASTGSNVYLVLVLIASAWLVPMRQAFGLSYPSQAAKDQSLALIDEEIRNFSEIKTFGRSYKQEQVLNELKAAREKIVRAPIDPSGSGSGGSAGGNSSGGNGSGGNAAAILQANQAWEQRRQTLSAELQRRIEEFTSSAREKMAQDTADTKQTEVAGVASLNRKGQDVLVGLDALERSENVGARRNPPPNSDDVIRNSREYRETMEQLLEKLRTEGLSAEEAQGFLQTRFGNSHDDAMKNPENFDPDESESSCCHDESIQVNVNASGNAKVNVTINKGQPKTPKAKAPAKPVNLDEVPAFWEPEENGPTLNYNYKGELISPKPVPGDANAPARADIKNGHITHYNDKGQLLTEFTNEKGRRAWKPVVP